MNLSIRLCDHAESLSQKATQRILDVLASQPGLLFCAGSSATPLRTYQVLAEGHARQTECLRTTLKSL